MSDKTDTGLWREALAVCQQVSELPEAERVAAIQAMDLSPPLQAKVQQILHNMSASSPLLDDPDHHKIIAQVKSGQHMVGQTIGDYVIRKLIAQGGMSAVYTAVHTQAITQKPVAIKLLPVAGVTPKAIELFQREQRLLAELDHPNIIKLHHSGVTQDGTHYLVMALIQDARTVLEYCAQIEATVQQRVELIRQTANALAHAHAHRIIHRDIKASNVLVDLHGHLTIIDFGIGRMETDSGGTQTRVFTPDTAAPEQILGQAVSPKTDVFSLGALLLELVTGEKALPKINQQTYHPDQDIKHIRALLSKHPMDRVLKQIILTAMHVNPADRYSSMQAFADDLKRWLEHQPVALSAKTKENRWLGIMKRHPKTLTYLGAGLLVILFLLGLFRYNAQLRESAESQRNSSMALLAAMIDQANPVLTTTADREAQDALVKKLSVLANEQADLLASDPQLNTFFHQKIGDIYQGKGLYQLALESYQKSFASLQSYVGLDTEEYIAAAINMAHLYETTGDYERALDQGQRLLHQIKQQPKLAPVHRLEVLTLLTKTLDYSNRTDAAEDYANEALAWAADYPDLPAHVLGSMHNSVAVIKRKQGDLLAAEKHYLKAVAYLKNIPTERSRLSSIHSNLGVLYGRGGEYASAEAEFQQAIQIAQSIDPNHPLVALAKLPYATLMRVRGNPKASLDLLKQALVIFEQSGRQNDLFSVHTRLARTHMILFELDQASHHLQMAHQNKNPQLDNDHPAVLEVYLLSMWLLMNAEDMSAIKTVLAHLNVSELNLQSDLAEHQLLRLFQALAEQRSINTGYPFDVVSAVMYGSDPRSAATALLSQSASEAWADNVLTTWLVVQGLSEVSLQPAQCELDAGWNSQWRIWLKAAIMQYCVELTEPPLQTELQQLVERWQQFQSESTSHQALVKQLISD